MLAPEVSPYALSKTQWDQWFQRASGIPCRMTVALEHFYGSDLSVVNFLSRMTRDLLHGVPSIPLTEGRQRRDFVWLEDVLDALECLLTSAQSAPWTGWRRFEVGSGKAEELRSVIERLRDLTGNSATRLEWGAVPYRPQECMESRADLSALQSLGWEPRMALDAGLQVLVQEMRERMRAP
jgi:nucleoside-diphosphate-sugar epimerase